MSVFPSISSFELWNQTCIDGQPFRISLFFALDILPNFNWISYVMFEIQEWKSKIPFVRCMVFNQFCILKIEIRVFARVNFRMKYVNIFWKFRNVGI